MNAPKIACFLLAVAALMLLVAAPGNAQSKAEPVRIVYGRGKNVYVQNASGGAERKATASEFGEWKAAKMARISLESPDGYPSADHDGTIPWNGDEGTLRLDKKWIDQFWKSEGTGHPDTFAGWFPGGKYFVIEGADANSSAFHNTHAVINLKIGKVMPFNGWVSANMRSGITPGGEGLFHEYHAYQRNKDGLQKYDADYKPTITKCYAVSLPGTIEGYRFRTITKRLLTVSGKPFHEFGRFQFSSDATWALQGDYKKSHVFSTTTGVGRQIGADATFLPPAKDGQSVELSKEERASISSLVEAVAESLRTFERGTLTNNEMIAFAFQRGEGEPSDKGNEVSQRTQNASSEEVDAIATKYFGVPIKIHRSASDINRRAFVKFAEGRYSYDPMLFESDYGASEEGEIIKKETLKFQRYAKRGDEYLIDIFETRSGKMVGDSWCNYARRATLRKVTENGKSRFIIVEYLPLP